MQCSNGSRRLLVAEDDRVCQMMIRHQLRCLGHEVDVVENGRQALEALARDHYDLILMDCQMPELDGYETTRFLRQDGNPLPVIAFTAQTESWVRDACFAAGMDDHLAKPAAMCDLRIMLDVWLPPAEPEVDALRSE